MFQHMEDIEFFNDVLTLCVSISLKKEQLFTPLIRDNNHITILLKSKYYKKIWTL
ncbi:MAG: hypothetical protein QG630_15 [Patescibacteria group bacterium]|nr:hypothetical protein [Patescibacteria group bacterium]